MSPLLFGKMIKNKKKKKNLKFGVSFKLNTDVLIVLI